MYICICTYSSYIITDILFVSRALALISYVLSSMLERRICGPFILLGKENGVPNIDNILNKHKINFKIIHLNIYNYARQFQLEY